MEVEGMKEIKKIYWGIWGFGFLLFIVFTPMSYLFHGSMEAVYLASIGVVGASIMIISSILNIATKEEEE